MCSIAEGHKQKICLHPRTLKPYRPVGKSPLTCLYEEEEEELGVKSLSWVIILIFQIAWDVINSSIP